MEDSTNLHYSFLTSPPRSLSHISSPETMEQWKQCTRTWKRKGCLATYSICLWPLLQSHWLGGVGNAAEHGQVGGIHALSSSRQEHRYLKSQALILALQHFHQSLNTRAGPACTAPLSPALTQKLRHSQDFWGSSRDDGLGQNLQLLGQRERLQIYRLCKFCITYHTFLN